MSDWTVELGSELLEEVHTWRDDQKLELAAVIDELRDSGLTVFDSGEMEGVPGLSSLTHPISLILVAPIPGRYRQMKVEVGPGRYILIHEFG